MKIFNKFIWSKKEPSNKNDIWFDGSTWRMYTEEAWQSFTLPVDAADKVAKMLENASEVYQEKLNAGYGIIIDGNTISVDDSILYDDSNVWEAIETLQQNKVEQIQLNDYVPLDRWASTSQVLMDNISELASIKLDKADVATINGQSLIKGGNIVIPIGESYDDTEIKQQITELSAEIEHQGIFIEDLQNTKIDRENDDYYPKMAVGLADNLAGVDVVDSEINFRRSGGGAISDGVARIETIKGNSVVWNQFVPESLTSTNMSITGVKGNYVFSVKNSVAANQLSTRLQNSCKNDHAYLFEAVGNNSSEKQPTLKLGDIYYNLSSNYFFQKASGSSTIAFFPWGGATTIIEESSSAVYSIKLHDLTQMFGAGNEPTTIEEFNARKPMGIDEYAYNEGEVIHMDVQSIESVGVNQWDEEWEKGVFLDTGAVYTEGNYATAIHTKNYISVIEGKEYYFNHPASGNAYVCEYDFQKNFIRRVTLNWEKKHTIPYGVAFIRFSTNANYGTTYNHDICINISDTAINGQYFPYIKRQEDLAAIRKYFPDGMKSAGTAHDEIRYNKTTNKKSATTRLKTMKVKDGAWIRSVVDSANGRYAFQLALDDIPAALSTSAYTNGVLMARYAMDTTDGTSTMNDKSMRRYSKSIYVRDDAYTDVASFLASFNDDDILYYELAEPIVTELDEADQFKDLDYQVWNDGTEKANAEGKSAPLAADITYGFNAIGKIKELESLVAALRAKVGI